MNRLIELRKEKHLNQVGLAMQLNVSQKMISAYECGVHQPSIDTLIQMSKIFGASVDYIIGISDIRMPAEKFAAEGLEPKERMTGRFELLAGLEEPVFLPANILH